MGAKFDKKTANGQTKNRTTQQSNSLVRKMTFNVKTAIAKDVSKRKEFILYLMKF